MGGARLPFWEYRGGVWGKARAAGGEEILKHMHAYQNSYIKINLNQVFI